KLPYNFSGNGYAGQTYQVMQWYPRPAPYDRQGWHPAPFVTEKETSKEAGDYDITLTIPQEYTVSATLSPTPDSMVTETMKTLHYHGNNITNFSWMAGKPEAATKKPSAVFISDKPYEAEKDKRMIILADLPKKLFD